jgi:hypothetical protein
MLGELQSTLVKGTAGKLADTGGLRDRIVGIGSPGPIKMNFWRLAATASGIAGSRFSRRALLLRQGAPSVIRTLVDLGILEDTGAVDFRNARIYVAPEVVRIVSS